MTISKFGNVRLVNETHYQTRDLKRFVRAAMEEAGVWEDGISCTVKVDYCRTGLGRHIDGADFYGLGRYPQGRPGDHGHLPGERRWWRLALPKGLAELTRKQVRGAAQIAQHEIDHTRGLSHKDMVNWWTMPTPWADGLQVRARVAALAVPAKVDREAKAREAVERLDGLIEKEEKRHSRAMKALRTRRGKATRSVRYYEGKQP